MGQKVHIRVVSYNDEWKAQVEALCRSLAVHARQLPELWGELSLAGHWQPPEGTIVELSMVLKSGHFRESAVQLATLSSAVSGDAIKMLLVNKQKWFNSVDKYSIIERTWLCSLTGVLAVERLKAMILGCLPTVGGGGGRWRRWQTSLRR